MQYGAQGPSEPRLPPEEEHADFGLSKLLVGRAAAVLFFVCGALALGSLALPQVSEENTTGMLVSGCAAALAGLITWYLPWAAWPRWAAHFLVPVGFALISVGITFSSEDPYLSAIFCCAVFTLVGVAHPQGTGLKMLPLFALAYIPSVASRTGDLLETASSALLVGLICVLVAEMLAWLAARLHHSQLALQRAHAAVNEISAELTSMDPGQLAETASGRLAELLDVPDVSVCRLSRDNSVTCLATIIDGELRPDHLDRHADLMHWPAGRQAVQTSEPVLISSSDDPLLADGWRGGPLPTGMRAVLLVPLIARGRVVGLAEIRETRQGRTITPEQSATAASVCRLIALSIQDAETLKAQRLRRTGWPPCSSRAEPSLAPPRSRTH